MISRRYDLLAVGKSFLVAARLILLRVPGFSYLGSEEDVVSLFARVDVRSFFLPVMLDMT